MSWTPEREEQLKKLWSKGHTASQISQMIGNTTRNAVIGKAHRLNLKKRAPSKALSRKSNIKKEYNYEVDANKSRLSRKARFKALLLDKNFEPENPKSLEELNNATCRWPIGHPDEKDFYFCGRSTVKDFSYCKLHVIHAYQPKNTKEDLIDKDDEVPKFIEKKIKSA